MSKDIIDLLLSSPSFAQLATINHKMNKPHIDTVWFGFEDHKVVVATTKKTKKYKNLSANTNAFMVILNHVDPYEQLQIEANLTDVKDDTDLAVCDSLSLKYLGKPFPKRFHKDRVALYFDLVNVRHHVALKNT